MDSVILQIHNEEYRAWESMKVTRSYESLAASFDLTLSDSWKQPPRPITTGAPVKLLLKEQAALCGYINKVHVNLDKDKLRIKVSGRDKLGDLVDCCPKPTEYKKQRIAITAHQITEQFGIAVVDKAMDNEPLERVVVEPGQTAHQVLTEMAKQRGVLLIGDEEGRLVITREQTTPVVATLAQGEDFTRFSFQDDDSRRYSEIRILGQGSGFGGGAGRQEYIATTDEFKRHRPLIMIAEQSTGGPSLQARGEYETRTRLGLGFKVNITVPGWGPNKTSLWKTGSFVRVLSASANLNTDLLISSVSFHLSATQQSAELGLVRPGSFSVLKEPPNNSGGF